MEPDISLSRQNHPIIYPNTRHFRPVWSFTTDYIFRTHFNATGSIPAGAEPPPCPDRLCTSSSFLSDGWYW